MSTQRESAIPATGAMAHRLTPSTRPGQPATYTGERDTMKNQTEYVSDDREEATWLVEAWHAPLSGKLAAAMTSDGLRAYYDKQGYWVFADTEDLREGRHAYRLSRFEREEAVRRKAWLAEHQDELAEMARQDQEEAARWKAEQQVWDKHWTKVAGALADQEPLSLDQPAGDNEEGESLADRLDRIGQEMYTPWGGSLAGSPDLDEWDEGEDDEEEGSQPYDELDRELDELEEQSKIRYLQRLAVKGQNPEVKPI